MYMCMAKYSIQVDTFYYSVNCNTSPKSTVPEDLAISPSHLSCLHMSFSKQPIQRGSPTLLWQRATPVIVGNFASRT